MRSAAMAFGLGIALASAGTGMAQEYSPSQVVDFFAQEIQTSDTCSPDAATCAAPEKPVSFDVLVNFALNSASLSQATSKNLTQVAIALNDERLRGAKFVVEGHTDARGSSDYNARLADARAAAVVAFLVTQGVSPDRMTALGLGEAAPRVPDPNDPVNRRVEIRLNLD